MKFHFEYFYDFWGRIYRLWAAAQIWLVPLRIVFNVSRFKPALNWKRFFGDLRRCPNSLNSDYELLISLYRNKIRLPIPQFFFGFTVDKWNVFKKPKSINAKPRFKVYKVDGEGTDLGDWKDENFSTKFPPGSLSRFPPPWAPSSL